MFRTTKVNRVTSHQKKSNMVKNCANWRNLGRFREKCEILSKNINEKLLNFVKLRFSKSFKIYFIYMIRKKVFAPEEQKKKKLQEIVNLLKNS